MWLQFFAQNGHFAINLLASLVCMAIAWLYFDAWAGHKDRKELCKWVGFSLLALSFLAEATLIEQAVLGEALGGDSTKYVATFARIAGYIGVIVGLVLEPPHIIPKNQGFDLEALKTEKPPTAASMPTTETIAPATSTSPAPESASTPRQFPAVYGVGISIGKAIIPIGGLVIAVMYWRIATAGLERHLKKVAIGFGLIALSDTVGLLSLLRETTNPTLYDIVKPFGIAWSLEQLLLLGGAIMLGRWVWSYLTKRFFSQLFMIFIASTVVIATIVCVVFTSLLLRDIRKSTLANLNTAGKVLSYAIGAKQAETTASAEQVATDAGIAAAVSAKDHNKLVELTKDVLVKKKQSSLIITNASGQVLLRAEDPAQWGDSISSDTLVQRALLGTEQSSVKVGEGVGGPSVQVRSAAIIKNANGQIIGAAITGLDLSAAFVDGVKAATGLESSIYGGSKLAATTITGADGKTRSIGTTIAEKAVLDTVRKQGKGYTGTFSMQNRQLLGAFLPLKDADNTTVGMLLVSQPESDILAAAGRSIELTFLFMVIFLVLTILPSYYITRSLERQIA